MIIFDSWRSEDRGQQKQPDMRALASTQKKTEGLRPLEEGASDIGEAKDVMRLCRKKVRRVKSLKSNLNLIWLLS